MTRPGLRAKLSRMRTTSSSRPLARHGIAAAIALVSVCAVLESGVIGCGGAKPASEQTDTQNAAPVATPAPAETTAVLPSMRSSAR